MIKVLLLLFIVFAISRTALRYRDRVIPLRWLIFWVLFWAAAGVAVLVPETTSRLAALVGVGRGADLVVYASLSIIFYLLFRILVRFERLERDLTKIVRELALLTEKKSRHPLFNSKSGRDPAIEAGKEDR